MNEQSRLSELEGIRGLLSAVIVLYHFGLNGWLNLGTRGVLPYAYWWNAVDYFFILSGFVLAHSQVRRPKTWAGFAVNRVFRLLPSHVAVLCLMLPVFLALEPLTPAETAASVLGIGYVLGWPYWNTVSWSMSAELYLPILLAPLGVMLARQAALVPLAFGLFLVGDCLVVGLPIFFEMPDGMIRGAFGIGLGYTFYLFQKGRDLSGLAMFGRASSLVWFGGYVAVTLLSGRYDPIGALMPVFAVLSLATAARSRSVLSSGPLVALGALTFTLYLVHLPLLTGARLWLGEDFVNATLPLKAALIVTAVCLAWLITRYVERPGMQIGRILARRLRGGGRAEPAG